MPDGFAPPTRDATLNRRTLRFMVSVLAELEFPGMRLVGGDALGQGYYYELEGKQLVAADVEQLDSKLQELIKSGDGIAAVKKPWQEALAYCEEHNLAAAKQLLESRVCQDVDMHECRGVLRVALYPLHASTGALKDGCKLLHCEAGMIASFADGDYAPQPGLRSSLLDAAEFGKSFGVTTVGELNALQQVGRSRKDFALACEFRQEAKLAEIAMTVATRKKEGKPVKIICIAGPTSSGKTTFANKLCMYLRGKGLEAIPLTVDHYYLPLDRQPKYQARNQRSDVDYDSIESMDVDLVGEHLNALVRGEDVMTPVYDMKTGYRKDPGQHFDGLKPNGILVIEGIHALNPLYTQAVEASKVFKVYISPLSSLQLDDGNKVKTTDHRLLRRMCRDYLFRGHSASKTLGMWDNVRKGEGVWIFPHQNNADFVMNSAAEYEIGVLKTFVEPLLRAVRPDDPEFAKALEVLQFLDRFATWPPEITPPAALLREFIGDGAFDCH